jgi:Zn-dependent M28 family amino/carboxypeptidase
MRKALVLFLCSFSLLAFPAQPPTTSKPAPSQEILGPATTAMNAIDGENIRAHVKFLADDLLEGRGTGQRGGDIAAAYIATQFQLYGLRPAGDAGTFLQHVPLVGITTLPQTTFELAPEKGQPISLKYLDQYVATDETQQPNTDVDAPIVFVGYGIDAPEYKWNDYKDADVRGKVLLMLVNEPPSNEQNFFAGRALTYYGRWTYKFEEAARKGAAGVILVHETSMASYGWDVVRNSWSGENSALQTDQPLLKVASWVQLSVAKQIAEMSGENLDALMERAKSRNFRPVPLTVKLKAHMVSRVRPFTSSNVLAILPGSDPELKNEAVVYTAHYDHLGIRPEAADDNIYNGAADNATGCGILLEIARAYAASAVKPKRSILFAAVTAEEQGLRGSEYLGKHSPIPSGRISLDLNFDDIQPFGTPEEVEVSGAERTTFYPEVESMAKRFHLFIRPDSRPEAGHYYRSDHFSLARVGVPSFSVNEGVKFKGHPAEWGVEQARQYNEQRYHQPADEYRPDMDFSGNALIGRFGFALGWEAANQAQLVEWKHGDEFEAARKKSESTISGVQ